MVRSFGAQTLTGNAQPLFGDKITAAFVPATARGEQQTVKVADSSLYQGGDRIILGADQASPNVLMVNSAPDSTTLLCVSEGEAELSAWPVDTVIALNIECSQIIMTAASANTGVVYPGADDTVTSSGGGKAFSELPGGSSINLGIAQYNALRTMEYWVAGTLNDKYYAGAVVI